MYHESKSLRATGIVLIVTVPVSIFIMLFYSIFAGLQGDSQLVIIGMYFAPVLQLVIGIVGVTSWDMPENAKAC